MKSSFSILLFLSTLFSNLYGLEHFTLDNGLEVFLIENHKTPLIHVNITFKTGSINENATNNGLSHLYEHMLFKGNDLYKNQNAFMTAMQSMGTSGWNGHTAEEQVAYYFTVPSSKTEKAIEFWAHVAMNPLLSPKELKSERVVVHNEITGHFASPKFQFSKKINDTMYSKFPFRKNAGGDLNIIDNATVEQLRFFKDNFYIPNNTAVIIAGDIDIKKTLELIKKYFGAWKKGPNIPKVEKHPPLAKDTWVVADTFPSKGQIDVRLLYMGPSSDSETEFTYPADVWMQMVNEPDGAFKKNIYKAVPELYGETRHISSSYETQREGETSLHFLVTVDEKKDMLEVINRLVKTVDTEFSKMIKTDYFPAEMLETSKRQLHNHYLLSQETIDDYASTISFWWAVCSTTYYLDYFDNLKKVSNKDIKSFVEKFLLKPRLIAVWVNKDDNLKIKLTERIK